MKKILIVDDEALLRANLRDMLVFEGYTVIEAADGFQGLESARTHLPDLIICDIAMPGLDGSGVLAELRGDPRIAAIPVILLTAKADWIASGQQTALGADGYVVKPFAIEEILAAIREHLES